MVKGENPSCSNVHSIIGVTENSTSNLSVMGGREKGKLSDEEYKKELEEFKQEKKKYGKFLGVRMSKSGRYSKEIRDPRGTGKRYSGGTRDTPQEAEEAAEAKKAILAAKAKNPAVASTAVSEVSANGYLNSSNEMKEQIIKQKEKEYVTGTGLLHEVVAGRAVLNLPTNHFNGTIPDLYQPYPGAVVNLPTDHSSDTIPDLYQPYPGLLDEVVAGRAVLNLPTNESSGTIPDFYQPYPGLLGEVVGDPSLLNFPPNHSSGSIPDLYQPYTRDVLNLPTNSSSGTIPGAVLNLPTNHSSGTIPGSVLSLPTNLPTNHSSDTIPDLYQPYPGLLHEVVVGPAVLNMPTNHSSGTIPNLYEPYQGFSVGSFHK